MKIGTIDIGTNSMRLLIADYKNNKIENRKKYINITRIGQGVDDKGYITEEALERNLNALKEFADKCIEEKCEKVYCMGTSALRDSKNGQDFVNRAKELTNIDVKIICGEEESNLGFMGVLEGAGGDKSNYILVLDIGGGSTEFIVGNEDGIKFCKSENVGALRMTEKFITTDPISDEEFNNAILCIPNIQANCNNISESTFESFYCGAGNSYVFINSSGDVGFCPTLSSTKFCGGNINEKTLNDIWINSKFFNHIRNVRCKYYNECPANYVCQGGCRSRAQFFGGSIGSPDIQECKLAYNLTGIKPKSMSL